jgi:hypothetical protein
MKTRSEKSFSRKGAKGAKGGKISMGLSLCAWRLRDRTQTGLGAIENGSVSLREINSQISK